MKLKVGDTITYRPAWGSGPAVDAKVEHLAACIEGNAADYGRPVEEVAVEQLVGRTVVADLDNGHWCYANQIDAINGVEL